VKLLRTIRFDGTDEKVFPRAAAAEELAVAGAFVFADDEPETLSGKRRQAFRSGFLGLESFGFATFACVAEVPESEYARAIELLAYRFFSELGAPDLETARAAAKDEVDFAAGLCVHPVNTVIAVEREIDEDGIKERFRVVPAPREKDHAKVWGVERDGNA
ncbi:MAG: DUF6505 family protein, partial [Planctomycetes bacterium]|nr:DUF6505 family protein [Planctomycetota bacterium]